MLKNATICFTEWVFFSIVSIISSAKFFVYFKTLCYKPGWLSLVSLASLATWAICWVAETLLSFLCSVRFPHCCCCVVSYAAPSLSCAVPACAVCFVHHKQSCFLNMQQLRWSVVSQWLCCLHAWPSSFVCCLGWGAELVGGKWLGFNSSSPR